MLHTTLSLFPDVRVSGQLTCDGLKFQMRKWCPLLYKQQSSCNNEDASGSVTPCLPSSKRSHVVLNGRFYATLLTNMAGINCPFFSLHCSSSITLGSTVLSSQSSALDESNMEDVMLLSLFMGSFNSTQIHRLLPNFLASYVAGKQYYSIKHINYQVTEATNALRPSCKFRSGKFFLQGVEVESSKTVQDNLHMVNSLKTHSQRWQLPKTSIQTLSDPTYALAKRHIRVTRT